VAKTKRRIRTTTSHPVVQKNVWILTNVADDKIVVLVTKR